MEYEAKFLRSEWWYKEVYELEQGKLEKENIERFGMKIEQKHNVPPKKNLKKM